MTRRVTVAKLHDAHAPIPKGWRKVGSAGAHRDQHAVLIESMGRKRKRERAGASEFGLHCAVARFLATALDPAEAWWTTIPAGGGGKIRGARLKQMGYRAGTPDVLIVREGRAYWIELKADKGTLSPVQRTVRAKLNAVNSGVAIARSIEDVQSALWIWGVPTRGRITA